MAQAKAIPLAVLSDNSIQVDFAITAGLEIAASIDRTVGLTPINAVLNGNLHVEFWLSWDGGTTFSLQGAVDIPTGTLLDSLNTLVTSSGLSLQNFDPNPTHVRIILTATGTMSVSGSLTTT